MGAETRGAWLGVVTLKAVTSPPKLCWLGEGVVAMLSRLAWSTRKGRKALGTLPAGGTATLVFSQDKHAGVLVMNNVPPPSEGTVYQMWLMNAKGDATSAGTMDAKAVAPSTTAVLPELGSSTELAFTVEPGGGSRQPTGTVFARLPLV